MSRFIAACGLIVTFTAALESASGATAAAGTGTASSASATGAGRAAATTVAAPKTVAPAPNVISSGTAAATTPNVNGEATTVGGTPGATGGSVATGTTIGGTPGATAGTAANGAATTAPTAGTTTTINPATGLPANTTLIPGQVQANGVIGNTISSSVGGTTTAIVPYTSLPQSVQASLVNQIPAGAQLGQIIQETTPQGAITYRAQIMQNGIASEIALNGSAISANPAQSINRLPGTASLANGVPTATGAGAVVGTPYAFESLPTPVQTAFTAQAGGVMPTNVTYVAGANGTGVYRGFANGRPIDVRVGANGQILPGVPQIAAANTTPAATNEVSIEDVPMAVRDAIKKSMPFAEITRVRQGDSASGKIFDVTLRNGTDTTTMQVAEDGTIVRENRENLNIAATQALVTNEPPKLSISSLPVVVRDTIETHTQPEAVRMLALTNFEGKTAYVADYLDKDALRHRLFIGKDGVVLSVQTNLLRVTATSKPMMVADLPPAARTAIEAQAPEGTVTRVDLGTRAGQPVYVVTYMKDGQTQQMIVSRQGERLDAVGAAATTESGAEKK